MKKWLWMFVISLWFLFPFGNILEKAKAEEIYSYQILYYYDSVLNTNKTETKQGALGDLIVSFPAKKENYEFFASSIDAEGLTISRNPKHNIIRVYYQSKKTKAPKTGVHVPCFSFTAPLLKKATSYDMTIFGVLNSLR